ncbi:hypothetical protein KP509_05G074800 [Ceratopteris richardii]|uniref:Uncharacterized protein n=1 Tax=Ceratopteris richardii TaxID=49495 RepID=A0A8T2UMY2_CERRI|nr:hypothetical protein KP509_05G074800 [Ceratopteris richardii]
MASVKVTGRHVVKPVRPSPQKTLFLSAMDIMFACNPHNRRLLFYKVPIGRSVDYSDIVGRLKAALAEALAHFWPLAGRIRPPSSSSPVYSPTSTDEFTESGCRMSLECNDEGAELLEARVEGIIFEEIEITGFRDTYPFFNDLVPWVDPAQYAIAPPLCIQISSFECGSFTIGIAISHVVCDGTSLWHFLTSWAEIARGEKLSLEPVHSRTLLKVDNPSAEKAFLLAENVQDDKHDTTPGSNDLRVFQFNKEAVKRLKNRAGGEYSSYEALCTHIWRHASLARSHLPGQKLAFIHIVNTRNRANPPLPLGYFGNAVMWVATVATAGELAEENFAAAAKRIHDTLEKCNEAAVQGWLHWLEVHGRNEILTSCMVINGARIRASSSTRFNVSAVDFGWGSPTAVRCPCIEIPGKIIFFPGSEGIGNVDMTIALPSLVMQRLEHEPDFMKP